MQYITTISLALLIAAPGAGGPDRLQAAAKALAGGDWREARFQLETALDDEDSSLQACRSLAALWAGRNDKDEELRWLRQALRRSRDQGDKAAVKELTDLLATRDPLGEQADTLRRETAKHLFTLAERYMARKIWSQSLYWLRTGRELAPGERRGAKVEAALRRRGKAWFAEEATFDKSDLRRSPAWVARHDRKHSTWENRAVLKGRCYTVETDCGYRILRTVTVAMENLNRFFKQAYGMKNKGRRTARVRIRIFRRWDDFSNHSGTTSKTVGGYYVPGANEIVTYDPRPGGESLDTLWETLFHEASHQFVEEIIRNPVPSWLDEGLATYFEGCRLLDDGRVEDGAYSLYRLQSLEDARQAGRISLANLLQFTEDLPGEMYCQAWGLAYMLMHWRNDQGEAIYRKPLRDYLFLFKKGRVKDPQGAFIDRFITRIKDPAVRDLAGLQARLEGHVKELTAIHECRPAALEALLARAGSWRQKGIHEAAVDALRFYCARREECEKGWYHLARALAAQGDVNASLEAYYRARDIVATRKDPAIPLDRIIKGLDLCDPCLKARHLHIDPAMTAWEKLARAYHQKGYNLAALTALDHCLTVQPGNRAMQELWRKVRSDTRGTLSLPITLWTPALCNQWTDFAENYKAVGEEIRYVDHESRYYTSTNCPVSIPCRLTVEIKAKSKDFAEWGLVLCEKANWDVFVLTLDSEGSVCLAKHTEKCEKVLKKVKDGFFPHKDFIRFTVDVGRKEIRAWLDDRPVLTCPRPREITCHRVGLYGGPGEITFRRCQAVRILDR